MPNNKMFTNVVIIIIISVQKFLKRTMMSNNQVNVVHVFSLYSVCGPAYGVGGKIHTAHRKE